MCVHTSAGCGGSAAKYCRRRKNDIDHEKVQKAINQAKEEDYPAPQAARGHQREAATVIKEDEYYLEAALEGRRPSEMMNAGIMVPLWYLSWWLNTYGCNNWRRRNALPMIKRYKGRKLGWT